MFAGAVLDIKMRPPQALLGAVPTGPLPGSGVAWGEGGCSISAASSQTAPGFGAGVSGRAPPGVRLFPALQTRPLCVWEREGGNCRIREPLSSLHPVPGVDFWQGSQCVSIRRTWVQAPIWASCFTYLGLSFPTCKICIIMLSQ